MSIASAAARGVAVAQHHRHDAEEARRREAWPDPRAGGAVGPEPVDAQARHDALVALEVFRHRPTQDLTKPPRLMTTTHLSNEWRASCLSTSACSARSLFCVRCDIIQQRRLVATSKPISELTMHQLDGMRFAEENETDRWCSEPQTLALLIMADLLTFGLPCGCFYHGLGTAGYGCWTRWGVRDHYRINSVGWIDFMVFLLFPSCAVSQHREEMALDGITPPSPLQLQ